MFSIHSSFLTETAAILEIHIIVFYHCYLIISNNIYKFQL